MAKTLKKPKKKSVTEGAASAVPRRLKRPSYKSFRLAKRIKGEKLPGAFRLFGGAMVVLYRNWKVFLGITGLYALLTLLFVQGFGSSNIGQVKANLDTALSGDVGQIFSGVVLSLYLLGSSGGTSGATAAYQMILILVTSLALIWTLRHVYAGNKVRIRDGFYQGMSSLVQFVLVLAVVLLQILPMVVGLWLYALVVSGGIAASFTEQVIWTILAFILSVVTLYMLTSSLFALYIVTLPDMTPLKALRSARQLVANRRWSVMRKILFLPVALLVLIIVIVLPTILFATPLAIWVFFVVSMLLLPAVHSHMYSLYRSLI